MKNNIKFTLWGRIFVIPGYLKYVAIGIVAVVAVLLGFYLSKTEDNNVITITAAPSVSPSAYVDPPTPPVEIHVYVVGEVENPGVYKISSGSMISDVISLAGGFTKNANPEAINMVEIIYANTMINVPAVGDTFVSPIEPSGSHGGKININTAGIDELCNLSGIGESTAKKIIAYRETNGPFSSIEDIMNVPGIKEARFMVIKEDICVG
ncbi:MAG: hypothetical protein E7388_05110 [Ruminococcaceae bacterium]|nr:hypothetical protein [Oscillospiraceae bacterium]